MRDDELAAEAGRGGKAALELLVTRHYAEVYAFAARRTGSIHAAQDIAQTVFENLVRALPRYRPSGRFRSWLFAIAANAVRDHYRRALPPAPPSEDLPAPGDMVQALLRREEYRFARRCVMALPDAQREALILYYYHGMSLKETARITGAGISTVKSRLRMALKKLKNSLEAETYEKRTQ